MPTERRSITRESGARFLLITASLVLVVAGLREIKAIALPLILAVFLSILSAPLLSWLCRHRWPRILAVLATVLANVTVMALVLLLIGSSINAFARSLPRYQEKIEAKTEATFRWLEERGVDTSELSWLRTSQSLPSGEILQEPTVDAALPPGDNNLSSRGEPQLGKILGPVINMIKTTLATIASILSMTLLVLLIMIFIFLEAGGLPGRLKLALRWSDETMARFTQEIQRYLLIKTFVSLLTGLSVGLAVWLLGVDYALLWGITAYLLNYIPSIGSIIAALPPVALTFIDDGWGKALLLALVYLAVNLTLGNFLEPQMLGRRFGISTLVVILSLIFWGWLWGPVGMLLSVPLTIIVKMMMENTADFRWLAQLMEASPQDARTVCADDGLPIAAGFEGSTLASGSEG